MSDDAPPGSPGPAGEGYLRRWIETDDREALDLLLREEIRVLTAAIRRRGPSAVNGSVGASDIAQQAVLGLLKLEEVPRFENTAHLRAYLWTSAWRLLCARFERNARRPRRIDLSTTASSASFLASSGGFAQVEAADRAHAIELALNLLEPDAAEILRMVYLDGQTIPEAAARVGISTDSANMRLVRARRAFARKLGEWSDLLA